MANLINAGIIPLTFKNEADYDKISCNDELSLQGIKTSIENGDTQFVMTNKTTGDNITLNLDFSQRQRDMLVAGGLLNYTKLSSK